MVYGVWCMVCTVCQCPPYIPPMRLEDMCSHPHHCTTAQAQCIHCIHCVHCVSLLCSGGGGDLVRYWFCDMRVRSWCVVVRVCIVPASYPQTFLFFPHFLTASTFFLNFLPSPHTNRTDRGLVFIAVQESGARPPPTQLDIL